jgi:non-heme chloroperoxidase
MTETDRVAHVDHSRRTVLSQAAGLAAASTVGTFVASTTARASESSQTQLAHAPTANTITTRDGTRIFYKDWGPRDAQPIVFHHGRPLSADDWDNQMLFFLGKGYRVIAHDRRGSMPPRFCAVPQICPRSALPIPRRACEPAT